MKSFTNTLLTINGGSSSIRFSVFDKTSMTCQLSGKIERIGSPDMTMSVRELSSSSSVSIPSIDYGDAAIFLLDWLAKHPCFPAIRAVGHRVVHGMQHMSPALITPDLLKEFHQIANYDPDHMPQEIMLIEEIQTRHPSLPQIACFDTSFHSSMPKVAKLLPIPRRYFEQGVQRYGFHGLSYAYLMEELGRLYPSAANGRVILAHLGNGASLAAVVNGESIDTSMGFSPASGLVMSSRSGDLDPSLFSYLADTEGMTASAFQTMVNKESGLLGVSETSSDLRDLLAVETTDVRASEAITLFCYQVKKWIGSFAAAMGGVDTLVFTGGIGENSSVIRERICRGLKFLGIEIHEKRNGENQTLISLDDQPARVLVIPTNEELMIARSLSRLLDVI